MWNPKFAPIKFIINIHTPPRTELNISFNILFSGHKKIFPNINKTIIQVKIVITELKSKKITSSYNIPMIFFVKLGIYTYFYD